MHACAAQVSTVHAEPTRKHPARRRLPRTRPTCSANQMRPPVKSTERQPDMAHPESSRAVRTLSTVPPRKAPGAGPANVLDMCTQGTQQSQPRSPGQRAATRRRRMGAPRGFRCACCTPQGQPHCNKQWAAEPHNITMNVMVRQGALRAKRRTHAWCGDAWERRTQWGARGARTGDHSPAKGQPWRCTHGACARWAAPPLQRQPGAG